MIGENQFFAYAKTKTQSSFAFAFVTQILQIPLLPKSEIQASGHLLRLHSPVCDRPGLKSGRPFFSRHGSFYYTTYPEEIVRGRSILHY